MPNAAPTIRSNQFMLVRTDGTEQMYNGRPTERHIARVIGCATSRVCQLNSTTDTVIFLDEFGSDPVLAEECAGLQPNPRASEYFRSIFPSTSTDMIYGDAVLMRKTEAPAAKTPAPPKKKEHARKATSPKTDLPTPADWIHREGAPGYFITKDGRFRTYMNSRSGRFEVWRQTPEGFQLVRGNALEHEDLGIPEKLVEEGQDMIVDDLLKSLKEGKHVEVNLTGALGSGGSRGSRK